MPSRKDARQKHAITDLSVRRQTRSRTSVENTLAMTSISGDATAFDQQFTRYDEQPIGTHHFSFIKCGRACCQALLFEGDLCNDST